MNEEIRAEKNFRLATVGGVSALLATASGMVSLWLIVTGDKTPGAILMLAAAAMLFGAQSAFGRIRPHRPEPGSKAEDMR